MNGSLSSNCLVFKHGWSDWKKLAEVKSALTSVNVPPPPIPSIEAGKLKEDTGQKADITFSEANMENSQSKQVNQPRNPRSMVSGQVIVHNNDSLIFAQTANISVEGVFIKTEKPIFNIGEILKLTCRVNQIGVPFNADAQVVRRSSSFLEPSGYGLYFTKIKPEIVEKIRQITFNQAS